MDLKSMIGKATDLARDHSDKLRKLGPVGKTVAGLVGGGDKGGDKGADKGKGTPNGDKRTHAPAAKPRAATTGPKAKPAAARPKPSAPSRPATKRSAGSRPTS